MNNDNHELAAAAKTLQSKYPTKEFSVTKNFEGVDVVAFVHDGMSIFDPYVSDCGRLDADPKEAYGIEPDDAELMVKANALTPPKTTKPSRI
ncbi:MAG: hypothetical protein CTY38_00955 [Methylotenera sp.]|uniref:hypothetical protein n=1 Tax=Methylotenera sp. TaxID=2051956 RepID=UPI000D4B5398|nr:hypothetical protein [Methylotenera sp.]PPC84647.1 MAG: hypothetical protein CTY38_00955 [Methylotenera sp.]